MALLQIKAKTIDGAPFTLTLLNGKVVLVMFWSTDRAVCRDKKPELRNNYSGWVGKPFELVAVGTDSRVLELVDYERIISPRSEKRALFAIVDGRVWRQGQRGSTQHAACRLLAGQNGQARRALRGPYSARSLGQNCWFAVRK